MSGVIGNSGFECIVTGFKTGKNGGSGKKGTIKNIKTGESIGAVAGQRKCPPRGDCWGYKTGTKTFYGLDDRYYHVIATWNTVKWGQVQSTGAVIDSKRSVITVLDFYPIYIQKPEPVLAKAPPAVQPVKVPVPVQPVKVPAKVKPTKVPISVTPVILVTKPTPKIIVSYVSPRGVKGTRTDTKPFIDKWLSQMIGINAIHKYKIDNGAWQTVRPAIETIKKEDSWLERLINWIKKLFRPK